MKDLGHYKTTDAATYHCHFDPNKKTAVAMGPLPGLRVSFTVEAENEQEGANKLASAIGRGVFTHFSIK
jgi:hypothetical protein